MEWAMVDYSPVRHDFAIVQVIVIIAKCISASRSGMQLLFKVKRTCDGNVKWGSLEQNLDFVATNQQDCAGGLECCWCRSCTYANSKPTSIPEFAVVS